MKLAAARGDIGTVMKLLSMTSTLTPADYIKKTVGSLLFMYYSYTDSYKYCPIDLDDLIDGLLFIDAKNYIIKQVKDKSDEKTNTTTKRRQMDYR